MKSRFGYVPVPKSHILVESKKRSPRSAPVVGVTTAMLLGLVSCVSDEGNGAANRVKRNDVANQILEAPLGKDVGKNTEEDDEEGAVAMAAFADRAAHYVLARRNGEIHEIDLSTVSATHTVIATMEAVAGLAAFTGHDGVRHVVVVQHTGDVTDLATSPRDGSQQATVVTRIPDAFAVAAYEAQDGRGHVLVASHDGKVQEMILGSGATPRLITRQPGLSSFASCFSPPSGEQFLLLATSSGNVYRASFRAADPMPISPTFVVRKQGLAAVSIVPERDGTPKPLLAAADGALATVVTTYGAKGQPPTVSLVDLARISTGVGAVSSYLSRDGGLRIVYTDAAELKVLAIGPQYLRHQVLARMFDVFRDGLFPCLPGGDHYEAIAGVTCTHSGGTDCNGRAVQDESIAVTWQVIHGGSGENGDVYFDGIDYRQWFQPYPHISTGGSFFRAVPGNLTHTVSMTDSQCGTVSQSVSVSLTAASAPTISHFSADPDYINPGSSTMLSFDYGFPDACHHTDMRIIGRSWNDPSVVLFDMSVLQLTKGNVSVVPSEKTTYTLEGYCDLASAVSNPATVTIYQPYTTPVSEDYVCFSIVSPTGICFTQQILASVDADVQAYLEAQNPNADVTQLDSCTLKDLDAACDPGSQP